MNNEDAICDRECDATYARVLEPGVPVDLDVVQRHLSLFTDSPDLATVEILASPMAVQRRAQEITGNPGYHDQCWSACLPGRYWTSTAIRVLRQTAPADLQEIDSQFDDYCMRSGVFYAVALGTDETLRHLLVCGHPDQISVDTEGELHSEVGPAVAWPGYALFLWHGTEVPKEWIEQRDTLDPTLALNHQNVELRRVAAEIVGWPRVLESIPTRTLDKNPDPEIGELFECDLPDWPAARFVRVRCPTGREFVLPVDPTATTALAGVASTYGKTSEEYTPEFRT